MVLTCLLELEKLMCELWNTKRKKLQEKAIKAILDIFEHTNSNSLKLDIDNNLFLIAGDIDGIRCLLPNEHNKCKTCPHIIGDTYDRDCCFPDCVGGWEKAYSTLLSELPEWIPDSDELWGDIANKGLTPDIDYITRSTGHGIYVYFIPPPPKETL